MHAHDGIPPFTEFAGPDGEGKTARHAFGKAEGKVAVTEVEFAPDAGAVAVPIIRMNPGVFAIPAVDVNCV